MLRHLIPAVLCSVVLLGLLLPADQQSDCARDRAYKCDLAVTIQRPPNSQQKSAAQRQSDESILITVLRKPSLTDWLLAGFTLALVLIGRRQFKIMDGTLTEARKAADASRVSANASLNASEMALVRERAYLRVESIKLDAISAQGAPDSLSGDCIVAIKNYGKTPATLAKFGAKAEMVLTHPSSYGIPFINEARGTVIADGGVDLRSIKFTVAKAAWEDSIGVKTENSPFFACYGFIRYWDIFENLWTISFWWDFDPNTRKFIRTDFQRLNNLADMKLPADHWDKQHGW